MHKELKATLLLLGWTGTASDTRWLKTENNRPITSLYLLKSAVVVCNLENENEQKNKVFSLDKGKGADQLLKHLATNQ